MIRVFREVFSETNASFIHSHLRRQVSLEKVRIPMEVEKFRLEITEMLGPGGLTGINMIVE